jgi:hypothetical protein
MARPPVSSARAAIPAIKLTSKEKLRNQPGEEGIDSATAFISHFRNYCLSTPENNGIAIKYACIQASCKVEAQYGRYTRGALNGYPSTPRLISNLCQDIQPSPEPNEHMAHVTDHGLRYCHTGFRLHGTLTCSGRISGRVAMEYNLHPSTPFIP